MTVAQKGEDLIGKKIKMIAVPVNVPAYRRIKGETGIIKDFDKPCYGVAIDNFRNPGTTTGLFWCLREDFIILDEPIKDNNKKEEQSYMQTIVEKTFDEVNKLRINLYKEAKNNLIDTDEQWHKAASLVAQLRQINEQTIEHNKLYATSQSITLDPMSYATTATINKIMELEKQNDILRHKLEAKEGVIKTQLKAFAEYPIEQERILKAYDILDCDATIQPVTKELLRSLLDMPRDAEIFKINA